MVGQLAGSERVSGTTGIRVIDSHTEGEPTRVVIDGGPDLGGGSLLERRERFRRSFDDFRRAVILEPRGSDVLVGALLCEPVDPSCAAGVIFFNNTGYLGMCGHGAIGVAVTLGTLGRISTGTHRLETPVGIVEIELHDPHRVSVENVPSYRWRTGVSIEVESLGTVTGDVAWGGNWFFLVEGSPLPLVPENARSLSDAAMQIRQALRAQGITGEGGAEIDHIEFCGPAASPSAHSRNFVLCPGGAWDRSPCGTGTSAKLACLAAGGKLRPEQVWVQESLIGSRFSATYREEADGKIIPRITGRAYVCSMGALFQQPDDPFRNGIGDGGTP
jgi:4-hydroxyproline epimerase